MFIIGGFDLAPLTGRGTGFDGVVGLDLDNDSTNSSINVECTGSLLQSGRHILTAAHCIDFDGNGMPDSQNVRVVFDTADDQAGNFTIMTSTAVTMDPLYRDTSTGLDWAVLTLPAIAPFGANRYPLYSGAADLGSVYTMAGYGTTGIEANQLSNGSVRQRGNNRWEQTVLAGTGLRSDFDDGTPANNLFGDLGVTGGDQFEGRGDSGGPGLINMGFNYAIAGIVSYGGTFFGEENVDTRVNRYLAEISAPLNAPGPFIVDFAFQPSLRDNGVADTIVLRRSGANVQLTVNGVVRQEVDFALITEIQVVGSQDADTLFINEDNGRVIPAGGVKFDGGAGAATDSLEYKGGFFQNVIYYPDNTTFGDGRLEVSGFGNIDFENLEPVTVSALASLIVATTNSQDDLVLDSPAPFQNRLSGTSGGVPFEPISFFDVANVTVDMGNFDLPGPGTDRLVMTAPFAADLLNLFRVVSGPGNDFISVIGHPSVAVEVQGEAPQNGDPGVPPGDTLAVDAAGFALVNAPRNQPNGVINAVGMAPIRYSSIESLVVSDVFESNDTLATATVLGSEPEVTLRDLSIHDAADEDWFQITANQTGKLAINVFFKDVVGDLDFQVRDSSGDVITGSYSVDDNEQVVIPVVSQEIYYIVVYGFIDAVNNYSLEIENFALPVPILTDLVRSSDTGESWSDNVTRDNTPTLDVLIDLVTFTADVTSGRTFLTAAQAGVPTTGFGVVIAITDAATGVVVDTLSDPLGINSSLWRQTTAALPDGTYLIAAAAYVIDGQNPKASGNGAFGAPLVLTIDTVDPTGDPVDLATESDSGFSDTDNVTSIRTPTFEGFAEPGTILRLLAGTRFVGMTVVGSDESDGIIGNNRGRFSVQSHALDDGVYNIRYTLEDLAGHVSLSSAFLPVQIDSVAPNTPYLDIPASFDTGISSEDNVTRINTLYLSATTHNAGPVPPQIFANNLIYRIYVRPDSGNEVLLYDSSVAVGAPTALTQIFTTANLLAGATTLGALPDGVHNFKLEVEDRAGNISEDFLLPFKIDTTLPAAGTFDLASESDSGFSDTDNVTSIQTPNFTGTATAGMLLRLFAGTRLVGTTTVGSDASDGVLGDGLGLFNVVSAALDDGVYNMTYTLEDVAGNISLPSNVLTIQIDTVAPNTPYLDIPANFDTGISPEDNVTRINTLYLSATTHNAGPVPPQIFADNLIYRVYVRPDSGNEILLYNSSTVVGGPTSLTQIFTTANLLAGATTLGALPDGVHNFKLEVEDRAGNISEDFLLPFKIDTGIPASTTLDLASESDSGFSNTDNVTSIQTPNFTGVAEAGLLLRLFAGTRLVGTTTVGSDESDGVLGNGLGRYSVASEALADGVYNMTYTLEDLAGNISPASAPLTIQVDTVAPNTPYLDIPSSFDTGRNDEDNVTRINTLLLSATTHNAGPVPPQIFANNLIYRVWVRPEVGNELLMFDSSAAVGAPTALTQVFTTANLLLGATSLIALPDGAHNFKLEVEDRAGNISADFLLPFVIDTVAPASPTLRLDPAVTDTGLGFDPGTLVDNITRASTPGFYGRAEANSIVRLSADKVANNVINGSDVFIGLAQTIPLDGNDAFPQGQYRLTSVRDLNNPADAFPLDGLRQIGSTAEDLAGNISVPAFLDIAIDTTPPQVTAVDFTNGTSVFAPKPLAGVTPRVDSILVTFRDSRPAGLPAVFDIDGVDLTQAVIPGNYVVRGDHTGRALIKSVEVVSNAGGAVTVRLNFASPLLDDRYTLQISEDVSDPTGNLLDGDSRASEPGLAVALLPSGNQIPGGNFAGRFTVDSRPEVGTLAQGIAYLDINGNNEWDPQGSTHDATNRDFVLQMGTMTDAHFAGNFARVGAASASGFDKLGVYGLFGATYSFAFDTNDDGVADVASVMPSAYQVNGIPVAGNFNAAHPGDEIGLFDGAFWYLDTNGNNQIDVGERIASNFNGLPLVGDFNGDGADDLATYNNDTNTFFFDTNRNGQVDFQLNVRDALGRWGGLGSFTDRPVAGDLNLDGVDDLGLWVKSRSGQTPLNTGEYFFWLSDRISPNPALNFDSYSPSPLGNDLFTQFGDEYALPIFGNFDPPIQENPTTAGTPNLLHRTSKPMDTTGDNFVSPLDVLVVINVLNSGAPVPTTDQVRALATVGGYTVDVDNDRQVTPLDVLAIINFINAGGASGEGESSAVANSDQPSARQVDDFFSWYEEDEEWLPNRRRRS